MAWFVCWMFGVNFVEGGSGDGCGVWVDWKQGCPAGFFFDWGFRRDGMIWYLWR